MNSGNQDENARSGDSGPPTFRFNQPPTSTPLTQNTLFGFSTSSPLTAQPTSTPQTSAASFGTAFGIGGSGGVFGATSTTPSFGNPSTSFTSFGSSPSGFGTVSSGFTSSLGGFGQGGLGASAGAAAQSHGFGSTPVFSTAPVASTPSFGFGQQSGPSVFRPAQSSGPAMGNDSQSGRSGFGAMSGSQPGGFGGTLQGTGTGFMTGTGSGFTMTPQSTAPAFGGTAPSSSPVRFTLSSNTPPGFASQSSGGSAFAPQSGTSTFATRQESSGTGFGFQTQLTGSAMFRPASSGGFGFVTTSTTAPMTSTPQVTSFNLSSSSGPSFVGGGRALFDSASRFDQAPSAPPMPSSAPQTNMFSNPVTGAFQWRPTTNSTSLPTGPVLSGAFPSLQPTMTPPSGISPTVSLAAVTPIPTVSASQSAAPTASAAPRVSEIQPDTTPAHASPPTSTPASSPATSTPQTATFNLALTPASTAPSVSAGTPMAQSTPQTAVVASTGQDTLPAMRGMDIGAVLHEAIPVARAMEDDFHFIAERLAERDVAIVKRSAKIAELVQEYEELLRRQAYFEQQMQGLESQIRHTQQHAKAIMESFEEHTRIVGREVPLRAAFDQMYDNLVNSDTVLTEMEAIMDKVLLERTVPIEARATPYTPSRLDIEQVLLELREIDARRSKLEELISTM